ncbi:hypothetical protein CHS0354_026692 [Potamilus streckersoni]|uniref:Uncharacterized protein n=1 Tax=Potamilus streckersoni TaxID=2493646 RepID=A0AAE0S7Z4_9BIVA|nr:hypothetical protein CHS0354_026692 [Potamilus streckersoni]
MSHTKPPYASICLGLSILLVVIYSCSGGLVYVEDKIFTTNYFEGEVVYTDNHTTTKFIHCVSVCIKECMPPCPLISFTDGICRCHSSYARINKGQYATDGNKTKYFRLDNKNDGKHYVLIFTFVMKILQTETPFSLVSNEYYHEKVINIS